ncbi:MAG: hypothetical protein M1826_004977 [Phylliscum demangeonii]|nr:MAG: hypothetical protein M1826_004977 [Phylliscum demangeonii]
MVHLSKVPKNAEIHKPPHGHEKVEIADAIHNEATSSVYGSRFAAEDLPKHEMPEQEMPKEVAYRMIKDDLSLDGNPMLNLASFVTTYMEEEAEKLMMEALPKNFIDYEEYPQSAEIAIILGTLALKKRWQNKRKAKGKASDKPNIIMSSAVQAARYLDVEERYVYCTTDRFVIDPEEAVKLVDENTIGMCVILGSTYTGEYEDVKAVNDLLIAKKIECDIHVDAASGGFVAPFLTPELEWDFRLERVVSINTSGHKYGLVYPGIGWVVWRSAEHLPQELVFNINYLGADQASFTLNFSKGASQVIGQYYQLIRLGKRGYRAIMLNLRRTADYLTISLKQMGFIIMSKGDGQGLPLVAFRLNAEHHHHYDEFAIAHHLRERGWIVPAYTMAPHAEKLKLMRVVVREDFSLSRCDQLVSDIKATVDQLNSMDKQTMDDHLDRLKQNRTAHKRPYNVPKYKNEKHSLQGKSGKTHAVC